MANSTITPKELAEQLGSDGRTVRKFLRSITPEEDRPGKGNRWALEAKQVRSLRKQFEAWSAAKAPAEDVTPEIEVEAAEA